LQIMVAGGRDLMVQSIPEPLPAYVDMSTIMVASYSYSLVKNICKWGRGFKFYWRKKSTLQAIM
jgi:hypothetical protein